jgi:hypothetical protein
MAATLYLKSPQRIMALMMVMTLCLLVYAALEYRLRQALKRSRLSPYYMYSPWRGVASGERFGYLTAPMSWLSCS